jgi:hypothetical protein
MPRKKSTAPKRKPAPGAALLKASERATKDLAKMMKLLAGGDVEHAHVWWARVADRDSTRAAELGIEMLNYMRTHHMELSARMVGEFSRVLTGMFDELMAKRQRN